MDAFRKLNPRWMVRNPVMFIVEVGSLLTTFLWVQALLGQGEAPTGFIGAVALWLWFTVLFANFSEALAEGRGKAQADALRRAQVGTAQLAIEYCNALVDNAGMRAAYFTGFNFAASAATAFDTPAERAQITGPLIARAVGTGIATQPSAAEVAAEVDALIGRLAACGAGCASDRTFVIVKSA